MKITHSLEKLIEDIDCIKVYGTKDIDIVGISDDSRKIKKDFTFIAIKGLTFDAHKFIPSAIDLGASVVVGEEKPKKEWLKNITYVKVVNSRKALSLLSSAWYGHPSKKLKVIGITGTDGKTTTAKLIYWILTKANKKVGLVTTVDAIIEDKSFQTGLHVTNPEPLILQKFLYEMVKKKCEFAVLEVTSHGLDQERVAGIDFDIAALTNVTDEHLDYHKTFSNYLKSKLKLFENCKIAIINKDDKSADLIKGTIKSKKTIETYSFSSLKGKLKKVVQNTFPQNYNRQNAACAISTTKKLGISEREIIKALPSFPGVIGRMDEIKNKRNIKIFVDFAHTPNSLKSVLTHLKGELKGKQKLICVFGCAGQRDIKKRMNMGNISSSISDISVFTAEDPRNEDVREIIKKMEEGTKLANAKRLEKNKFIPANLKSKYRYYISIFERGEAISFAINNLIKKGDILVICGKGHEKSMAYGDIEYPWSDHDAVKIALKGGIKVIKRR